MKKLLWLVVIAGMFLTPDQSAGAAGDTNPVVHYAPAENFKHLDVALIAPQKRSVARQARAQV